MSTEKDISSGSLRKTFGIKVLGVGGAGCNAVNHLAAESLAGLSFAVMNTDAAALDRLSVNAKVVLGIAAGTADAENFDTKRFS